MFDNNYSLTPIISLLFMFYTTNYHSPSFKVPIYKLVIYDVPINMNQGITIKLMNN